MDEDDPIGTEPAHSKWDVWAFNIAYALLVVTAILCVIGYIGFLYQL